MVQRFLHGDRHVALVEALERSAVRSHERAGLGEPIEIAADGDGRHAEPIDELVDTTGAGDLSAAGFLFGCSRGVDLATCGALGSLAAAEVISHIGARPEVSLASLLD